MFQIIKNECGPHESFKRLCVSEVQPCQQPAKEAGPLGSKEADEEVDHRGDEDDAGGPVVQVVESLLIGWHV